MKIMVCYDGSSDNTSILEKAMERAKASGASIYLLSVLVGDDVGQLDRIEPAKKDLVAAKEAFEAENIPCETKVLFGSNTAAKSTTTVAVRENRCGRARYEGRAIGYSASQLMSTSSGEPLP